MLTRNGFPEVYNLKGGIIEWQLIEGPEATGANAFSRLTGSVEIEPILMEAYESTHPSILDDFEYIMEGYRAEFQGASEVEAKIKEIIERGRYT